ncbi:MAG: putative acetyltransferase [Ferruginibacter sp.]|nr:putative acetyltransferase [Ferruginibacter sp.]
MLNKLNNKLEYFLSACLWKLFHAPLLGRAGANTVVLKTPAIVNHKCIFIGDNFTALQRLRLEAITNYHHQVFTPQIIIGNNVTFNTDVHIGCINKIVIGDNVLLASRIYISDHSHGEISTEALTLPPNERPLVSKGPVIIGNNAWIGEGVAIMPGVTIGVNAIIGANSVVTKDIPANAVAAGVPAQVLRIL